MIAPSLLGGWRGGVMNKQGSKRVWLALTSFGLLALWLTRFGAGAADSDNSVFLPLILKDWPPLGRVLITEVLYNPDGKEPDSEWMEIYNAGGRVLDLAEHKIGDEEIIGEREGMFQFPPGATLAAGDTAIIAYRASAFYQAYGFWPDYEFNESDPWVPNMIKYTAWSGGNVYLENTGDDVLILDDRNDLVDAVSWGSSKHFLDPSAPLVQSGHSIERYPADMDTDRADDWRDQPAPDPGEVELKKPPEPPIPTQIPTLVINEIHADPDSTFGDANGDGIVDVLEDEFVEIVNITGSSVDIGGWTINDGVRLRHTFSPGTIIADGCSVVVFGGGSPDGDFGYSLVQTASQGTLGLNNDGDTLTLYDPAFTPVLSYTYGIEGGDNQSLTRDPDISGPDPLVKHSTVPASGGALYSPGQQVDGGIFIGCTGWE